MKKAAAIKDAALFLPPEAPQLASPELGLYQLAAWLRRRGRRVSCHDLNAVFFSRFLKEPRAAGLRRTAADSWRLEELLAVAAGPDPLYELFFKKHVAPAAAGARLAGFSLLTHTQVPAALYLARRLKETFPGIKVVFGGPWCTASLPAVKDWAGLFGFADALVFYEGEKPLEGLCAWARGRRRLEAVPNLAYAENGQVKFTPLSYRADLRRLPPPDFSDLDLSLYSRRALPYQTSAGCYWGRCVFCYHCFPLNRPATKGPRRVCRELAALKKKYGVPHFWLADLAVPPAMLRGLAAGLPGAGVFWSALARPGRHFTPELARGLYAAGCLNLSLGLETSSAAGLRRIRKGLTAAEFAASARACADAGIRVDAFLLNYPGQTAAELRAAERFVRGLGRWVTESTLARFELGRSSNAAGHLRGLGLRPAPSAGRDLRSFSLPASWPGRPLMKEPARAVLPGRGARRGELLLLRPAPPRAGAAAERRAESLALKLGAFFGLPVRSIAVPPGGEGLRAAEKLLRGTDPRQVYVAACRGQEEARAAELLRLCRRLLPSVPLSACGPGEGQRPDRLLAAGACRVLSGVFPG